MYVPSSGGFKENIKLEHDTETINGSRLFNDDEEPTKQEISSFRARPTGKKGVTVDHWYNKLALEYVSES